MIRIASFNVPGITASKEGASDHSAVVIELNL